MASSYLDKFRSGLKALQSRQIMALLTKEKNAGTITTVEEFKNRLNELTNKLANTTISPTLQLFLAKVGDVIDSESFNFMLDRIQDDLESAFSEANDIDTILESHEAIINDVVIKNLELAINDLESKIEAIEFVNGTTSGFDRAVFNTFRATQNNRQALDIGIIFIDPKTQVQSGPGAEALVDIIGEKLLLGVANQQSSNIRAIRQIFDVQAKQSELNVEFDNSSLSNILDDRSGTYWTQSILLSQQQGETGVFTKLELDLGTVQTVNFLQIEPILLYPVDLYSISYIDENNQSKQILTTPVTISSTQKLFFNSISTSKLQLTFRNKNFSRTQFEIKPDSPVATLRRDPLNSSKLIASIQPDLLDLISSPRVQASIGLTTQSSRDQKKYYEYFIGFDNIEIGYSQFEDVSIFISPTETITSLGQAALKVLDKRPVTVGSAVEYTTDTQPADFNTFFHTSLEYYLVKRDFNDKNALISSIIVPVLPLNTDVIRHERLVLDKKSNPSGTINDIGTLQFYTDDSDIHVYRNGVRLVSADDFPATTDGWKKNVANTEDNPGQPLRMRYSILIQQPSLLDIYTVSYTPNLSTSNIIPPDLTSTAANIVDLSGNLLAWLGKDNIIYFPPIVSGTPIDHSAVNLVVVLRRNTASVTLTPVVEEYLLALGSSNPAKFGDGQ